VIQEISVSDPAPANVEKRNQAFTKTADTMCGLEEAVRTESGFRAASMAVL
jgi:hypothetical protein